MQRPWLLVSVILVAAACSHAPPPKPAARPRPAPVAQAETPAPAPAPAPVAAADSGRGQRVDRAIYFDFDARTLRDDARPVLQEIAQAAKAASNAHVRIEGNCDERGTTEYNLALGDQRARAAQQYLEALGVARDRIEVVSYGSERPKAQGHDESAYSQNRRDDLSVR